MEGGYPTDFTDARMTLRLRGELETKGTNLVLLSQAKVGERTLNHVLVARPFAVTPEWTEQTITLAPDPEQWLCLGSRHDRMDTYGWGDIGDVLRDVNRDIILVLHPVDVMPAGPTVTIMMTGNMNRTIGNSSATAVRSAASSACALLVSRMEDA